MRPPRGERNPAGGLCRAGLGGGRPSDRKSTRLNSSPSSTSLPLHDALPTSNKSKVAQREYEGARHVVSEIQRVAFAERALGEDDHRQLGQYMFQSHESSRDFLKNSTPELDALVELARAH